jgi:hypothetical protein
MMIVYMDSAVMQDMKRVNSVITATRRFVHTVATQRAASSVQLAWTKRRDRPWLAIVAVALAMNASGLVAAWWLWVPLLLGAATCTPEWRWSWVLSFQLGVVGTEWAFVGATSLGQWPGQRLFIGAIWALLALLMAVAAKLNRRLQGPQRQRHWR